MAYNPIVSCRCYQDRKARPPDALARFVRGDRRPYLRVPAKYTRSERDSLQAAFRLWCTGACAHADFEYASGAVNNKMLGALERAALLLHSSVGGLDALFKVFPRGNGDVTDAACSAPALAALDLLMGSLGALAGVRLLVDGEPVFSTPDPPMFVSWFSAPSGEARRLLFDHGGLAMEEERGGRWERLLQAPLLVIERQAPPPAHPGASEDVTLTDPSTGRGVAVVWGYGGQMIEVVTVRLEGSDLPALETVRGLLLASIETGNPIEWW